METQIHRATHVIRTWANASRFMAIRPMRGPPPPSKRYFECMHRVHINHIKFYRYLYNIQLIKKADMNYELWWQHAFHAYFALVLIYCVPVHNAVPAQPQPSAQSAWGAAKKRLWCAAHYALMCGPYDKCECMPAPCQPKRACNEWPCAVSDRSSDLCLPHTSSCRLSMGFMCTSLALC